jgi:antitoxin MazE
MSEVAETAIKVWGNGLAVRLTRSLAKAAGVAEGTPVRVTAEPGRLIIEITERRMTLKERLERFDPQRHGGEAMAAKPVGLEIL